MLHRVRDALSGDGELLDAEELRDALWLAARLPPAAATALARAGAAAETAAEEAHAPPGSTATPPYEGGDEHRATRPDERRHTPAPGATATGGPARPPQEDGLHTAAVPPGQAASSDRSAMAVRTPEMKALDGTELRLGRALRPLRQLRPDALRTELDVDATVSAMAETGLPDAVLRPARTRWLDLAVLVDDGVSMLLWQRLAGEARALMERCGAFRDVRVHGLDSRTPGGPRLTGRPYGGRGPARPMSTVLDPSGNTMLLVVSDGVGRAWRDGTMHRELDRVAAAGPVAVLHALPPRLWEGSGIGARPWRVTTRRRGAANRSWHVEDPLLPPELAPYDGVPVPVLSAEGGDMGTWAQLIGSPGETVVLPLLTGPDPLAPTARERAFTPFAGPGTAEEAVLRFKTSASSEAYRLAAHLAAVAPLPVPAMRLIQHALRPAVDTAHLAEVFLGGLMHGVEGSADLPHQKRFDFPEDIRTVLLGTVPPSELVRTARAVTAHLTGLPNASTGFPAWLSHSDGPERVGSGGRGPFGWVDETLRRRLGIAPSDPPEPESAPEPEGLSPHVELRPLPDGFVLDADPTRWRRLAVADRRYEGADGLPYEVLAEYAGGWSDMGLLLAHDGEGRVLVIRTPEARNARHGVDLVRTELTALKRLEGHHAPRLLAWDTTRIRPWLAVECALDGESEPAPNLRDFVRLHGALHQRSLLYIARRLARSLTYAHQSGLIHGSLTARSVLVAGREIQITGWMTASVDGRTSPHWAAYLADSRYLAPEHEAPHAEPTAASDVYALGIILLEAATGTDFEEQPEGSPRALPPGLSAEWITILDECTQRDPERRPSAERLLRVLDSLEEDEFRGHRTTVYLGLDRDLHPVRWDLESEHREGQGPHLMLRGLPAAIRRSVLRRVLHQLTRQNPTGLELVRADYDGRSGLTRFEDIVSGASFLSLCDGPAHVLAFCEKLRQEVTKRQDMLGTGTDDSDFGALGHDADTYGIPHVLRRLVVVVEDFQKVLRLAPEVVTALRQIAEAGPRLGMHLIVSTDDTDGPLTDRVFAGRMPARIDLREPWWGDEDRPDPVATEATLRVPSADGPVLFLAGVEDDFEPFPGI